MRIYNSTYDALNVWDRRAVLSIGGERYIAHNGYTVLQRLGKLWEVLRKSNVPAAACRRSHVPTSVQTFGQYYVVCMSNC